MAKTQPNAPTVTSVTPVMSDDELNRLTDPKQSAPIDIDDGSQDVGVHGVAARERPATAGEMNENDDDVQPFPEDDIHETAGQQSLDANEQSRYAHDHKMIWVRPRRNLTRTRIGGDWHTFEKGKEYQIAQWKADWLMEQGYL